MSLLCTIFSYFSASLGGIPVDKVALGRLMLLELIRPLPAAGGTILKKCRLQSQSDQAIFLRGLQKHQSSSLKRVEREEVGNHAFPLPRRFQKAITLVLKW